MRALFRPFALHAAYTPIETIVFFCILGTLCYFHILSAIKNSTFLDPAHVAPIVVKPAWAVHRVGEWVGVREGAWLSAAKNAGSRDTVLEIQQVVINLDTGKAKLAETPEYQPLSLAQGPLSAAAQNLSQHLTTAFRSPSGRSYAAVCHRTGADCFEAQQPSSKSFVQTLAFKPGMRDEWVGAILHDEAPHAAHAYYYNHHHNTLSAQDKSPRTFVDENGVRFEVDLAKMGGDNVPLNQMRNGKWVAYAARALVIRFWDLAKKADSLDILLILAGYILMHTTFYLLLIRSRALGSSFWLPLAILSSAVLSFLIALPIAMAIKIPIDPVALTEALPFLVCTVGFDKPLRLARAVFLHPHLTVPPSLVPGDNASGYPTTGATATSPTELAPPTSATVSNNNTQMLKPAPKIITESLTLVYAPIIRDYLLEIAVLTFGAYSKVGGLKEVCALAALILSIDCLLMCTYLAAILGVMVEVRRIKTVRAMTRSRSNSISSNTSSVATARLQSAMSRPQVPPPPKTLRQRVKSALLGGEKGSGLPEYGLGYGYAAGRGKGQKMRVQGKGKAIGSGVQKQENPVARLKLLLIASFLTLHILNLITPLTPSRHNSSPSSLNAQVNIRKVDITAPALRSVLNALVDASTVDVSPHSTNDSDVDDAVADVPGDIFVKVLPPVYMRAVPSPAMLALSSSSSKLSSDHSFSGSAPFRLFRAIMPKHISERVEAFMTAWTRLVGDPILSKWITILLAISITLNGYLLKGIAAGVVGVRLGQFGVRGAVRFEDEGEAEEESADVKTHEEVVAAPTPSTVAAAPASPQRPAFDAQPRIEPQSAPRVVVPAVATFTLEDVDKKLQIAKANSRRLTITSASMRPNNITPPLSSDASEEGAEAPMEGVRSLEECIDIFENGPRPLSASLALLNDEEVILLAQNGKIAAYALEKVLGMDELERAVRIRRALISRASKTQTLETADIPLANYDYSRVLGACCENVVGYIPLPLGIAGPLNVDGNLYPIPMATAEGTLVASTSRGCKALNAGGGVTTVLTQDAMTRGPAIDFPTITMAAHAKMWIDGGEGYAVLKAAFESTSRFARLKSLKTAMAGRTLFVRFATATGDAMGMNMISKGTEKALEAMQAEYPAMVVLALSGNYCTDKKPAAINWIEGRGKSVVAEAVIPGKVVKTVLKTTVASLVNLNTKKNLVGSAMAGSIGGFNAHAANILTAVFLATGQDPAQNVESSMCMTLMEAVNDGEDLLMTVSMPCIEVGTVGGGTVLGPQQAVLDMLGMRGAHPTHPGTNAQALARLIAAAVMAGELSLLSALAAGHLIRAHMAHNRSTTTTPAASVPATPGAEVVVAGSGHGQLASEGDKETPKKPQGPLTPSSSTTSLPPYSQ